MHKKIDSSIGMSYFGIMFDSGGIWENEGLRGCSHFMEHLMCKTYEHLYSKMRRFNVSDNAFTMDNNVVFFASGLDECISEFSQVMLDELLSQEKLWTSEQFETEKKIILQEYGDSFNDQFSGAYVNAIRKYFGYFGALGAREDIENFTYDKSLEMAKKWFSTPRKIITVGNHDIQYTGNYIYKTYTKTLKFDEYDVPLESIPKEDQSVVSLVLKEPVSIKKAPIINLLRNCLANGLESPLYQEVREKRGLAYFVYFNQDVIGNEVVLAASSQTANENVTELVNTCKEFFARDMRDVITQSRFEDCKKGIMYQKKQADILPHTGIVHTEIYPFNTFDGIENFTYEQVVDLGNKLFNGEDNFQVVVN
jgi:predicted Zn-dependent peptidase